MKSILSLVLVSACASTGVHLDSDTAPRTGVALSLVPTGGDDAVRVIPAAIEPRLPSVDRLARQIRYEVGPTITAELALCVSPQGNVTSVALAKPTALAEVDAAIVTDIAAWQFAPLPGNGNEALRTCQQTTLEYRVP